MKKGVVIKSDEENKTEIGGSTIEDMKLINQYTRKDLTAEQVYTFSVVLCDNDIDRDFERFTVESLFSLQELFLGKTGIFDHNPKAENQSARIYHTYVESIDGKTTQTGDQYFRLVAKAYIPRTECTGDLIDKIDTGILKEVSVGCAIEQTICSICGNDINSMMCSHQKGEEYDGKICYGELTKPTDAYEWSFVAVPAQREAGVIKAFKKGEKTMEKIMACLKSDKDITLNNREKKTLLDYINNLKKEALDGRAYRESLMEDVKRFALLSKCGISADTMESIVKAMNISQLCELRSVYEKKASAVVPVKPQTYVENNKNRSDNRNFTI